MSHCWNQDLPGISSLDSWGQYIDRPRQSKERHPLCAAFKQTQHEEQTYASHFSTSRLGWAPTLQGHRLFAQGGWEGSKNSKQCSWPCRSEPWSKICLFTMVEPSACNEDPHVRVPLKRQHGNIEFLPPLCAGSLHPWPIDSLHDKNSFRWPRSHIDL